MSNLSALRVNLLFALNERKDNCERMARCYLADNRKDAAAQCRAAAGAVQECIEAVTNIMAAEVEVEPQHVCGLGGFGLQPEDRCPACEEHNLKHGNCSVCGANRFKEPCRKADQSNCAMVGFPLNALSGDGESR